MCLFLCTLCNNARELFDACGAQEVSSVATYWHYAEQGALVSQLDPSVNMKLTACR